MSERPHEGPTRADPLSDVLRVVPLGAFFYAVEPVSPGAVKAVAVAAKDLTPRILPAAENVICYHIVTQATAGAD